MKQEADGRQGHDQDLGDLDPSDETGLFVLVGKLTCGCGEEEKRNNQKPAGHRDDDLISLVAKTGRNVGRSEDHQENQSVFKQIVVEGAKKLRHEERQKTLCSQKMTQVGMHGRFHSRVTAELTTCRADSP